MLFGVSYTEYDTIVIHARKGDIHMEQRISIATGTEAIMEFYRKNHSPDSIRRYQKACDLVIRIYEENSIPEYEPTFHEQLVRESKTRIMSPDSPSLWFEKTVFRVLSMLRDYYAGMPFKEKYLITGRFKHALSPCFESWTEDFKSTLKQKPLTVPVIISIARDFFFYLQEKELEDFSKLDGSVFYSFLEDEKKDHGGCMGNVCYVTKLLISFLRERGFYNIPPDLLPFVIPPARKKILPALKKDDIENIMSSIDLSACAGKRDYAILMHASFTGLRSIDIANLRLEDINWNDLTIQLVQHKTSASLALPMDAGVAAAVADYILHARPETESRYVFLTECRPYRKLSDKSSVANVFNKYVRVSGIDKSPFDGKSFHAIRRSMGAWLLNTGAKPEMISQILGHQDRNVLKRYLPIEQESLRVCALDFSGIPLKSEVYV